MAGDGLVGRLLDDVLLAQIHRVPAELPGDEVHRPLDDQGAHLAAEAAVGAVRALVGHHHVDVHVETLHHVRPGQPHARAQGRPADAGVEIAAGVHDLVRLDPQDGAVPLHRNLHVVDLLPGVQKRHQALPAGLDPLHRPAGLDGHQAQRHHLRRHLQLVAEAAAHVGSDDPDLELGKVQDLRKMGLEDVGDLGRAGQGQLPGAGVVLSDAATGLDGGADVAVHAVALLEDEVGLPVGGVHVPSPAFDAQPHVVVQVVVQLQRIRLEGFVRVHQGLQRLVRHLHQLRHVVRRVPVRRRHQRHRLAHETHPVMGQTAVVRLLDDRGLAVAVDRHGTRQRIGFGPRDRVDALGMLQRLARVHTQQPGVGVGAAHEGGVEHARQADVVHVGAGAGNVFQVFAPLDALTDHWVRHG